MKITQLYNFFGVSISYFHQVKLNNKVKYDLMLSFDENPKISILKYIDYTKSILDQMEKILHDFEDGEYGKMLYTNKILNHTNFNAIYDDEVSVVFEIRCELRDYLKIRLLQLRKWGKIIDIYNAR